MSAAARLDVANGHPDERAELERARQLIHDLRNPVGAVRLAVQMLAGPLLSALEGLAPDQRNRVVSVLSALETSTAQLCHLVDGGRPVPPTTDRTPSLVPMTRAPALLEVDELIRRLEILTVTRSALPALLAVQTMPGLQILGDGPEVLRALSNLVENAIEASARYEPSASPWTVGLRTYLDPAEVLGDEMDVVVEIRNHGAPLPKGVVRWLSSPVRDGDHPPSQKTDASNHGVGLRVARRVAEEARGRLETVRIGSETVIRLRIPQAHP